MKKLNTIQKFENLNEIFAIDDPGPGGAYHLYQICKRDSGQISDEDSTFRASAENMLLTIQMQCGPRKEPSAQNGVIDADLLEIVRDRLTAFQSGPYACRENACALTRIEEALMWLNRRAEDRITRGVLGTYEK